MRKIGRREAKDISAGDGLRPQPRAQRVADYPTQPGRSPAVGLDGRGVVMRLDLETEGVAPVEINHPRVILKGGKAPGLIQFPGYLHDGALEQVIDDLVPQLYPGVESLVLAMLRPGLRQRLQFDIGGIPPQFREVALNLPHLVQVQLQLFPPQPGQAPVVKGEQLNLFTGEFVVGGRQRRLFAVGDHVLNDAVDQQLAGDKLDVAGG
ncbi:hypothetical protein ES708_07959 [subsurface metagenome]